MLQSMTGYGRGRAKGKRSELITELRSVNSKFLEIRCHLPRGYADYEQKISAYLKKRFARGSIDLSLYEDKSSYNRDAALDIDRAKRFFEGTKKLAKSLKLKGEIDINTVLRYRDLYSQNGGEYKPAAFELILKSLKNAGDSLEKMRKKEGTHLEKDIRERLDRINTTAENIEKSKDLLIAVMMEKLKKRVEEIRGDVKFDHNRLEQEIVLYAAKADISEELTRLNSHIKRAGEFMNSKSPCGRNLDFLVQEMNREVNTIGSKSQSTEISKYVVDLKGELEKIREQVQNIE